MNVTLVGTGNVAFVLSKLLVAAGHSIGEVLGRNTEAANSISRMTGAKAKVNFSRVDEDADIVILAVADNAIATVTNEMEVGEKLIVHTSGATSKNVLNKFSNYGVLYPLQSLRKEINEMPAIPFFIDANRNVNIRQLQNLVASTGNTVNFASDEERLRFHVAAVLCSNFTNHLYALTQSFCEKENIAFENLLPLIYETQERLQYFPAAQMQTGPAIRHDEKTIERHQQLLKPYPEIINLYRLLTDSIQHFSR